MRKLVLLLGVAVLVAAIWMIVASLGVDPVPMGAGQEREAGGADVVPGAVAGEEAGEVPEVQRSEVEPVDPSPDGARVVRVQVANKESGEPIPGAEVSWYESFSTRELTSEESEEYARLRRDPELAAQRYGTTVLADERGEVFLPVVRYVRTAGRHGELYGELVIQPDAEREGDEVFRLELERDSTLVVQVLDSLGGPAVGVPVGVIPVWGNERDQYGRSPLAVSEEPGGFATIPHMQIKVRGWERQTPPPIRYSVQALVAGLTEEGETVDPRDPPATPLVVKLPPAGRVVARVTDVEGKELGPELVRGGVELFVQPPAHPSGDRVRPPASEQWRSTLADDGTHVFDRVVAGKTYVARSRAGGMDVEGVFQGPAVEGHEVRTTLSLEGELYFLVGRTIDVQRQPIRNSPMSLDFERESGGGGSSWVFQTDDRGYFKLNVPGSRLGREVVWKSLTIEEDRGRVPRGSAREGPLLSYSWRGRMPLVAGENDLGDVILDGGVLVASGRILVDGETLDPLRFNWSLQGRQFVGESRERWGGDEGLQWNDLGEGRFEVRGTPESSRYRLLVRDQAFLPVRPIEFVPGTTGLEIDLETGGSLRAEVLVDEEIPLQGLELRLIPTEGQDRILSEEPDLARYMRGPFGDRTLAVQTGAEDGRHGFQWSSLWAGRYRFELGVRGSSPLLEIPDVQITQGERNEDSRLHGIDLRGKLRSITVKLRDQDGNPIPEFEFGAGIVLVTSVNGEMHGFTAQGGSAAILTGEPFLDLFVAAQGYEPAVLPAVTSDITVRLERFPDVTVRVLGGAPKLPEQHSLRATVSQVGRQRDERRYSQENQDGRRLDQWLRPPASRRAVDESGEVRVQVGSAGTYRVRLRVQDDRTGRSGAISDVEPETVQLTGSGSEVIEVRFSAEALARALEQAGRG